MKKLLVLTVLIAMLILTSITVHAQKKLGKLEIYDVKVPTILKLGGDEVGFKLVVKNVGNGITSNDDWEVPVNVKVFINGSVVSSDGEGLRFWCPQIEPGDTYEKEYTVRVREKFKGERIKIEVASEKMGSMTREIDLER